MRSLVALVIRPVSRTYCRFEIVGEEHLRSKRLVRPRCESFESFDAVCPLAGLPLRRLHRAFPAAAADYFFKSVPRTWIATVVVNALPLRGRRTLGQPRDLRRALAECRKRPMRFSQSARSRHRRAQNSKVASVRSWPGAMFPLLPCYLTAIAFGRGRGSGFPRREVRLIGGAPRNYASVPPEKSASAASPRNCAVRWVTGGTTPAAEHTMSNWDGAQLFYSALGSRRNRRRTPCSYFIAATSIRAVGSIRRRSSVPRRPRGTRLGRARPRPFAGRTPRRREFRPMVQDMRTRSFSITSASTVLP